MRTTARLRGDSSGRRSMVLAVTSDLSTVLIKGVPQDLMARGWDVHVVSAPGPRLDRLRDAGVQVWALPMQRDPAPLADLVSLWRWILLLRRIHPTLVSAGTPKAGLLGMLAARLTGVPHRIYTVRGLRLESVEGPGRRVLRSLERLAAGCATHVLAVSGTLRDSLVDEGIAHPDRTVVIGAGSSNGVVIGDEPDFDARAVRTGPFTVGFVGRPSPDKGLDLLLGASRALASQGHTLGLTHVGGGLTPEHTAALEALGSQGWDITIAGEVDDVLPLYEQFDVLCLPTKREGFPNVVLEAGQAGVPTIATMATGIPDAIVDGQTGLIVRTREPADLACAIATLATDRAYAVHLGRSARKRIQSHFARSTVWDNHAAFYEALHSSEQSPTSTSHGRGPS